MTAGSPCGERASEWKGWLRREGAGLMTSRVLPKWSVKEGGSRLTATERGESGTILRIGSKILLAETRIRVCGRKRGK